MLPNTNAVVGASLYIYLAVMYLPGVPPVLPQSVVAINIWASIPQSRCVWDAAGPSGTQRGESGPAEQCNVLINNLWNS